MACLLRVLCAWGESSVESVSKKTRSPTLTAKSCGLPGVDAPAAEASPIPAPAPPSGSGVFEQAANASATPKSAANLKAPASFKKLIQPLLRCPRLQAVLAPV